jgi:formylglycine-generating enzyme required for sulfatase activity
VSLGDERTVGDGLSVQDTILDDIEIVDLEARYRVEGSLGQGGMGAVLLATDTRLDRKVAIKRILGEAAGNRMAVNRFLTEAKSIAALNHQNIVQIYDYGRAADGPFLIMEYVDGGTLLDRCRAAALPLEEAVDLACQICDGLAKAHDLGIIHRDIKPANVLLTKDGIPKLTDFGLAKVQVQAGDHGQTVTGAVLGTPDFMPPEQRHDASLVDHRSDLWSLAATVYQMVTGRSPKIIRFDLLPAALTDVLGKALEDDKESRYQSARELRDAIKASLRAAAVAPAPAEAVEGQCPSCGVQNDVSRKFCRGCGGSLAAPCLSCDTPMPMWEEICGSCGAKQTPLVETRLVEMAAAQAKAEGLLGDFAFEKATEIATRLRDETHPRLSQLKPWAERFLREVEASRSQQITRAAESLAEAVKHEQAFDYLSAVYTLESIPDAMRSIVLSGAREPVTAVLERLKHKQAASRTLEALVKQRVTAKALDGLLPEVDKLLALQPDRHDIKTLRQQLVERHRKQEWARDQAIEAARSNIAGHDYDGAIAALANVPAVALTPEVGRLREQAEKLAALARKCGQEIRAAVAGRRLDGLLRQVDAYLSLKPADEEIIRLRQSLVAREEKIAAEIEARVGQAMQFRKACRFAEAAKVLEVVPRDRLDDEASGLLEWCQNAAVQRTGALRVLAAAKAGGYADATHLTAGYRQFLAAAHLEDAEFAAALSKVEAAQAEEEHGRRLLLTVGVVGVAALALIVLVGGGLWIRSSLRAASVAAALASSRWDDVLAIDPRNVAAYEGRARERLSRSPPDIAGAFADIESAEKVSSGSAAVKPVRAWAHAARAAVLAQSDKLAEAARDLAEAVSLGGDPSILAPARAAIATAWLIRADKARDNHDVAGLRAACDAAAKAGAPDGTITTLRIQAMVVEARGLLARGERDKAIAMALAALEKDAPLVAAMLTGGGPAYFDLLAAMAADYRRRFDEAVAVEDWKQAVAVADTAGRIFKPARAWPGKILTPDVVRTMTPETLASLPASVHASLPPGVLTSLPPGVIPSLPPIRNSIGIELKLVPAGSYTMGQAGSGGDDTPHRVTLTRPFYLGVYEVTNAEWKRVMGSVESRWKADSHPVEQVNWEDAVEFCRKLSALPEERTAERVYRLPTEAEWEYACRAGTTTQFSFGDNESVLGDYGWFDGNAGGQTHPVGEKKPNGFGLYDMHGNVLEWVSDWYGSYPNGDSTDPQGPSGGSEGVCRGGSWDYAAWRCRSAFRPKSNPSRRNDHLGFRIAWSPSGPVSTDAAVGLQAAAKPSASDAAAPPRPRPAGARVVNSIGISLAVIAPGEFMMGTDPEDAVRRSPDDNALRAAIANDAFEERQHRVRITRPFLLGIHEVTQRQYRVVMGENPSRFVGDDLPVEHLTWKKAHDFCMKLTDLPEERAAGRRYRLPTEAEWEYACRAGTTTRFHVGENLTSKDAKFHTSYVSAPQPTAVVGSYPPNAWGLHDMHGNVWEWTADWFDAKYFYSGIVGGGKDAGIADPKGPAAGTHHVLRGGSSSVRADECHSAIRGEAAENDGPGGRMRFAFHGDFGLRVACDVADDRNTGSGQ